MVKGIHDTKVHKDCPFGIETLDEFRNIAMMKAKAKVLGINLEEYYNYD